MHLLCPICNRRTRNVLDDDDDDDDDDLKSYANDPRCWTFNHIKRAVARLGPD